MSTLLLSVLMLAPPAADAVKEDAPPFVLPTDQRYASHLAGIRDHAAKKDWAIATTLIQKLLDLDEDVFVSIRQVDRNVIVSLRGEANRLLLELPAEGRAFYQQEYGPKAVDLLSQGRMFKDERMLVQTVRRYLHTEAGLEACERLALFLANRGHNSAAVYFKHVLERLPPEKLSVETLQKAALALRRAGDGPRFDIVWRALAAKPAVKLEALRQEIEQQSVVTSRSYKDWPTFRGDPSRNAAAAPGVPVLEPLWKYDISEDRQATDWIKKSAELLRAKDLPILPAQHPLTLALSRNTGVFALSLHRSFWGEHARALHKDDREEIKAGEIFWEAPSTWGVDRMMKEPKHSGFLQSQWEKHNRSGRTGILFENTTFGTSSTDGLHHFLIEDLQVPAEFDPLIEKRIGSGGALGEALRHNRLQGVDIESGKLMWELGEVEGGSLLAGSFFLSAPLILDKTLHVLNEKDGAIRLLRLDPSTGNVLSHRTLVTVRDKRPTSVNRQLDAAHLACSDGILVCPTNAGVVLGVDASTGRTLWVFDYETRSPKQPEKAERWRFSSPIIHRGRVILAPPDSPAIYCIDLHDGSLAWKDAAQEGDLYIGGVVAERVVIVGAKSCRAVDMTNGKSTWRVATGTPSGMGIASGELYLLPLAAEVLTREPEICLLHAGQGRIAAHVRSRKKDEVPGNLAFVDGYLLSQTTTSLALYPLRPNQAKLIEELAKHKPNDPEVIARRGIEKQNRGDLRGALEDYRTAVANGATREMREYLRGRLHESTRDIFRNDLATLAGIREWYDNAFWLLDASADAAQFRNRCWAQSLVLAGRIQEQRQHPVAAAEWYLALADCTEGELLSPHEDPELTISRSTWVRVRLAALLKRATVEERMQIDKALRLRFEKAAADLKFTASSLRELIALVEAEHEVGRAARLKLVELLDLQTEFLEIEHLLLDIRRQSADRVAAGRALEKLALLSLKRGLAEDGAAWFRELARDFAGVKLRDGKTGKQLFQEALADRRQVPFLTAEEAAPLRKQFKISEEKGGVNAAYRAVAQDGNALSFFRRHRFDISKDEIRFTNQREGEEAFEWGLYAPGLEKMVDLARMRSVPFFRYQTLDHLTIATLGPYVFALDPIARERRWGWTDLRPKPKYSEYRGHEFHPEDGSVRIHYQDWTQFLPRGGLISPAAVVLPTREGLIGLEPLTGKLLWRRPLPRSSSSILHDGENLFIIDRDAEGEATKTRILKMSDGTTVLADLATPLLKNRLVRTHGGTLLLAERDGFARLTLRQYDLLSRKDRWRRAFLSGSLVVQTEEDLTGVVQPDGTVIVIDLESGKEMLKAAMKPEHLKSVGSVSLLRDAAGYYLACRQPRSEGLISVEPDVAAGCGLRSTEINGWLYSFAPDGQQGWATQIEDQAIIIDHFRSVPVVTLSTRFQKPGAPGELPRVFVRTCLLDKVTGKSVYDRTEKAAKMPSLQAITSDPSTGIVELLREGSKLRITPEQ